MPLYSALAGVRFDLIFRDADAIAEAYTVGMPLARERFGPDVRYGGPGWAGISYGHVNCLGSHLEFPEDSEVAHSHIYDSLEEGIAALQKPVDWANAGLMPFYLDLWEKLKKAFPDHHIPFSGFGWEGPITTAWELRGHGFFTDIYDDPERCHEFLYLVTESITDYIRFINAVNGRPSRTASASMCDDLSSMIRPDLWPEMVLPYHEQYYSRQTDGPRYAHIENLVPDHLPHLDELRLDRFDPSVSPRLTPRDLRDRCHVPFLWRLNAMQVRDMERAQIRRFVFDAVADGASGVFCYISRIMTNAQDKVQTFIDAAKQVESLLAEGCPREKLRDYAGA